MATDEDRALERLANRADGGVPMCFCMICGVYEGTSAIVTYLGSFQKILPPGGPYFLVPFFEKVHSLVNLRQRQVVIQVNTKVGKAEIGLVVKVQYKVLNTPEGMRKSKFELSNPEAQITAYVQDTLRSAVSDLTVESVFDSKDEVGQAVFTELKDKMAEYGYEILHTLVTDVQPTAAVKNSFNRNNLNKYLKESDKFRQMISTSRKNAESEASRKRDEILGNGISQQRQEIVNGLKGSVDAFADEVSGVSPGDVLELVLITQYFDMLKDIGEGNSKIVFTPGENSGTAGMLRDGILQANA